MFFLSFLRESAEDSSPPFLVFSFVRFATSPLESLTQAISENQMYTKVTKDSNITLLGEMPIKFIGNYFVTFAQTIKH